MSRFRLSSVGASASLVRQRLCITFSSAAASCLLAPLPLMVPPLLATLLSYAQCVIDYNDAVVVLEATIGVDSGSKDGW
jgi:hypothetical protein